jgi:hypothetical protein
MADWFLYECAKCGMKCVRDRAGGDLECRELPCSASGDEVTYVPLLPDGEPKTMNSAFGLVV